jgi:hypothetical protein
MDETSRVVSSQLTQPPLEQLAIAVAAAHSARDREKWPPVETSESQNADDDSTVHGPPAHLLGAQLFTTTTTTTTITTTTSLVAIPSSK